MTVVDTPIRKMKEIALLVCIFFLQRLTSIHAAPPIESCPPDSVIVEDICKCNPSLCSKPPCPYDLTISVNGTDTPGSCCPIYSCDGCSNDTLIDGKCPCAPGATLDAKGECKCVDPHKTLTNNECVCNEDLCELPQICDVNHVSVPDHDGCCPKTKCIKCPSDSFSTNNNDERVEDKCVCYPCTEKECGLGEKVVIMQHGNGFPGSCCDMYTCEKDSTEKKCDVEGMLYGEGDTWETPDNQMCKCQGGISFCTKPNEEESMRSCHKEGGVYKHNESWMLDSCTNCTCINGDAKCIAHFCEVSHGHMNKPECQRLNCSKVCPDGFKVNKRGCKICKCNPPYRYDDILHKYNITKTELKEILEDYFAHNQTTVASVGVSSGGNASDEERFTTPATEFDGDSQLLSWIIPTIILVVLVGALVTWGICWCCRCAKKGRKEAKSRSTTYERIKLTKPTMFNNNYIGNNNKDEKNIKGSV